MTSGWWGQVQKVQIVRALAMLDPDVAFEVAVVGALEYACSHTHDELVSQLNAARGSAGDGCVIVQWIEGE